MPTKDWKFKQTNWQHPFSQEEMEAMRTALKDEEGVMAGVLPLLRRVARVIPFAEDALAAWYCVRDPETSPQVRYILLGALAYFVFPFDIIADILPLIGFSDDAAVLATALAAVQGAIRPHHKKSARETLSEPEIFEIKE